MSRQHSRFPPKRQHSAAGAAATNAPPPPPHLPGVATYAPTPRVEPPPVPVLQDYGALFNHAAAAAAVLHGGAAFANVASPTRAGRSSKKKTWTRPRKTQPAGKQAGAAATGGMPLPPPAALGGGNSEVRHARSVWGVRGWLGEWVARYVLREVCAAFGYERVGTAVCF